ncbi:hypothetical protein FM119_02545 [Mycetocola reblochoni REB411]|uniref:Uncharacterized protein n=1 Tax=Mycetocola reblochoni REB411 TaxID=1255698 RepID=A0A1R4IP21_9MICO|nr:hypothetical protein FM119_02545 [Mycetocola reblochoni REB411]
MPSVVGALFAWLITVGVEVDATAQASLVSALTAILTATYWAIVAGLSKRWPFLQGLLGVNKAPEYTATTATVPADEPVEGD